MAGPVISIHSTQSLGQGQGGGKDIKTTVNALSICEHLPLIAEQAQLLAVIRSMTSKEGNHNRARYLVHTGYAPQGSMKHPGLGALSPVIL